MLEAQNPKPSKLSEHVIVGLTDLERIFKYICVLIKLSFHLFSIQKQHCEIKNEDAKRITIKPIGDARVLVNGEAVDDDEEEELHHLDRFFVQFFLL